MRRLILPIAVCVLYAGAALGQTSDEARALDDKALKAHGGEDSLKKYKAGILKNKGKIELLDGIEITQEVTFMLPDKFREEVSFTLTAWPSRSSAWATGARGAFG